MVVVFTVAEAAAFMAVGVDSMGEGAASTADASPVAAIAGVVSADPVVDLGDTTEVTADTAEAMVGTGVATAGTAVDMTAIAAVRDMGAATVMAAVLSAACVDPPCEALVDIIRGRLKGAVFAIPLRGGTLSSTATASGLTGATASAA